ncbi:MAG: ATP-dependent DNA helicase RecG [Treponema sp.]|nr:ATP-dependent DNA helicase RecG [Treponema sp.]
MKVEDIKAPVSSITGIGPQLTKTLARVNVFTAGDLLLYYPKSYEDRSKKILLAQFKTFPKVNTVAQVISQEWFGYGKMKTLKITVSDQSATAQLICFNRAYLEKLLIPGSYISLCGSFYEKYNTLQSTDFEVNKMPELSEEDKANLLNVKPLNQGIIPLYPLTEGLTQKTISKAISSALQQYAHGIEDEIPSEIIKERKLLSKQEALLKIHKPGSMQEAKSARDSLAYEEFFHFQSIIAKRALKRKGSLPSEEALLEKEAENEKFTIDDQTFTESLSPLQKRFMEQLPYQLTEDQKKVIYQIDSDIDRGYQEQARLLNQAERGIPLPKKTAFSMARLLQGDVGSGKTLVSLFACLRIISWKGQCAFMAPTEILAKQHAQTASRLLDFLGIRIAFLSGNVKALGRSALLKALKEGEIDIVIGTHALFSAPVIYKDLQMVVIDEQHRFGVLQRQAILAKGRQTSFSLTFEPHLLMMSATPIPQSLALTLFGDLDVSTIKTLPDGRKPVVTYLVKEGNEINAYEAVRKELEKGHQAYFVYPAINSELSFSDSQASKNLKSAEEAFEFLAKKIFPQYSCALIHSKIDEDSQSLILRDFRDNKIQILVATTVIEVGLDVPNASCMVIEGADHFGMAQLHQLRGRVGRGSDQSYCFLIYSKNISQTGIERMKALRQSTDGFFIAEEDLKTRGPGEINGTMQSGEMVFKIADLQRDSNLLLFARQDAYNFAKNGAL